MNDKKLQEAFEKWRPTVNDKQVISYWEVFKAGFDAAEEKEYVKDNSCCTCENYKWMPNCPECKGCYNGSNWEGEKKIVEKKYRPFNSCEELINHFDKINHNVKGGRPENTMPLIWVKDKNENKRILITGFTMDSGVFMGLIFLTFENLYNNYVFLDGSIIGQEE